MIEYEIKKVYDKKQIYLYNVGPTFEETLYIDETTLFKSNKNLVEESLDYLHENYYDRVFNFPAGQKYGREVILTDIIERVVEIPPKPAPEVKQKPIDIIAEDTAKIEESTIAIGDAINKLGGDIIPKISFMEYKKGDDLTTKGIFKIRTKRQLAKKIIMLGGNISGMSAVDQVSRLTGIATSQIMGMGYENNMNPALTSTLASIPSYLSNQLMGELNNEKMAHYIVYGKFLYDDKGQLVDNEILFPECVGPDDNEDPRIKTMDDNHPMLDQLENIKKEFKNSVTALRIKTGEIVAAAKEIPPLLVLAAISVASSAIVLPFGAGLPAAVTTVKNLLSSITALQTRISQLLSLLRPLNYIWLLLEPEQAQKAAEIIDKILKILYFPMKGIEIIIDTLVAPIMALVPKIPGQDDDTPAEAVEAELKVTSEDINHGDEVTLDVNASKGSWTYNYKWTSVPSGFSSTDKKITVKPPYTTKYFVKVTDKKDINNSIMKNIKITVH